MEDKSFKWNYIYIISFAWPVCMKPAQYNFRTKFSTAFNYIFSSICGEFICICTYGRSKTTIIGVVIYNVVTLQVTPILWKLHYFTFYIFFYIYHNWRKYSLLRIFNYTFMIIWSVIIFLNLNLYSIFICTRKFRSNFPKDMRTPVSLTSLGRVHLKSNVWNPIRKRVQDI